MALDAVSAAAVFFLVGWLLWRARNRCGFGHKWSKWRIFAVTQTGWSVQRRDCGRCGKREEEVA